MDSSSDAAPTKVNDQLTHCFNAVVHASHLPDLTLSSMDQFFAELKETRNSIDGKYIDRNIWIDVLVSTQAEMERIGNMYAMIQLVHTNEVVLSRCVLIGWLCIR